VPLGRYHQLMVDAYTAQHPVSDGSGIGLAFALIGLHLAFDEGWRGDQVRDAHRALATAPGTWPHFEPPRLRGAQTVFDVAMAGTPQAHAVLVQAWAADVWAAWRGRRELVAGLLDERLPTDVKARILGR
jgi:Family of unknown function (DUF5946)